MDILPAEICYKIFEHLNIDDLARSSMVSRKWRQICTDDRLWKRLVTDENLGRETLVPPPVIKWLVSYTTPLKMVNSQNRFEPSNLEQVTTRLEDNDNDPISSYKIWYGRRQNSIRRWKLNQFWTHNVDEESSFSMMGNGAVLVEVRQKELRVLNLSDGHPEVVETVKPHLPANLTRLGRVEAFNEEYMVVRAEGLAVAFLCYAWKGGRLLFMDGVYGMYRDKVYTKNIVLASTRSRSDIPQKSCLVQWKSVTLGRERIVLRTFDDRSTAYVWSMAESRCLGVLDCRSIAHGDVYSYGDEFYFCTFVDRLIKCDGTGVKTCSQKLDLNKHWISCYAMYFNPCVILLELGVQSTTGRPPPGGVHILVALNPGMDLLATVFSEHDQSALHPHLPIVATCKKHLYRALFEIRLQNLISNTVLWSLEFTPATHLTAVLDKYTFSNLNFVYSRYVVLVLSEVYVEKLLLDVETGAALFHDVLDKCHTIEYVGEKVIVTWDSECDGLSFKKIVVYT